MGGLWVNNDNNFDHISSALLTIFELLTAEGWTQVMYSGIDARGIDKQPK